MREVYLGRSRDDAPRRHGRRPDELARSQDLDVAYGRTQVVFGVSLEVPSGSLTCLMGRNGVGKTTLLNTVMGLLPAALRARSASTARTSRKTITYKRARHGHRLRAPGPPGVPGADRPGEPQRRPRARQRGGDADAINDAVDVFPALATMMGRPAGLLSGGQAQQLAIARALVTRPELLCSTSRRRASSRRSSCRSRTPSPSSTRPGEMTILLVEQYVEFALRLAERYAVMDGGASSLGGDVADADPAMFASLVSI